MNVLKALVACAASLFFTSALKADAACVAPPSGLVSWWSGDDHAYDLKGFNHGVLRFGATYGDGKVGRGFSFDGTSNLVQTTTWGMNLGTLDFSIVGWAKTTATKDYSALLMFDYYAPALYIRGPSGTLHLFPATETSVTGGFNDGQFHHFAVSRKDGVVSYFKDGVLIGTTTYTGSLRQDRFLLGSDTLPGRGLVGILDEVAFFERALTTNEIAAIFAAGASGMCKPAMPSVPFFIEAEDFDFNGGQHKTEADSMPYLGGAYNGLSATAEIDYHDPGANENVVYRSGSQGVAMSGSSDQYRDGYSTANNWKVGWNDPDDWYNYTRVFPLPARNYNIYARLSEGDSFSNAVHVAEVVSGAGTVNQTTAKIGEAHGPWSGSWDYFFYVPVLDNSGNLATVNFGGQKTVRVTILPGGQEDFNYLMFVPVDPPSSNACAASPSGLVAWWSGDGHPRDHQGNNHGTLQNGAGYTTGKVGECFSFDGANDYVETALDVQPSAMPSTTWECWVLPNFADPYRREILSCDDGGYDRTVGIEASTFSVFVGFGVWYPIGITPNRWQHIAVVYTPNNVEFYKNGVRFSFNAAPTGQATANKLQIGRNPGFGEYFIGQIDEVGIYNRALSATEIQSIYNAGSAGRCKTTVPCPTLTTPSSLSTGAVGTAYSQTLTVSGGAAPYTFALTGGLLPPSLALSSNGVLSGTLVSTGLFSFAVRITDNNGCSKPQSYSLTVIPRPPPCTNLPAGLVSWWRAEGNAEDAIGVNTSVAFNGTTFAPGKVGQAFSFDGSANYIRVGTNGMNVGTNDFTLEGWVKTTATRSYSCILSFDSYNPGFYIRYNGVLQFYPFATSPDTGTNNFNDGLFHHFAVARAAGVASYFKDGILIGTVAAPIVMNAQNIYIGTSTYGGENFEGLIDELSFYNRALTSNEVQTIFGRGNGGKCNQISCPAITLSPLTLPNGTRGAAYNVTYTASGGTAPYTFTVSSGALPAGLSLSSAGGVLSGTPGNAGLSSFTITATDAAGCSGTQVYSLAVDATAGGGGVAVAWGENGYGELGDGTLINHTPILPQFVKTVGPLAGKIVTSVEGGAYHSLVLASDGTVVSFGLNAEGQLGSGTTTNNTDPLDPSHIDLYRIDTNGALAGKRVTAVAAGYAHSLALTSDGKVFAWGENDFGAVGNNGTVMQTLPVPVDTSGALAGKVVIAIAAGGQHSLALTSERKLYQWGRIYSDVSTPAHNEVPVAVEMNGALSGKVVIAIADGSAHSLVLTSDGKLFAWGNNSYGQLGNGTSNATLVPIAVDMTGALNGQRVVAMGADYLHTLALTSDGRVYSWGNNSYGQLGDGTTTGKSLPGLVGGDLLGRTSVAIACGGTFAMALLSDGTVYNWGFPITRDSRNIPIAVSAIRTDSALTGRTVLGIAAGGLHALAIVSGQNQNCPAITLSPNTLPDGALGNAYNQTITATGGGAPYTFTASGTLPAGLTLSSAGVLSGTLTATGSFSFLITAAHTNNCSGAQPYTVLVNAINSGPIPVLLSVTGIPSTVAAGDSFTVTVTAQNNGGVAGLASAINASVLYSDGTHNVRITGLQAPLADTAFNFVPGQGPLLDNLCNQLPGGARDHLSEAADNSWTTGEQHSMSFIVTPLKAGTLFVRTRATLHNGDSGCNFVNDVSGSSGTLATDQQGWQTRQFSITVDPAPAGRWIALGPAPLPHGQTEGRSDPVSGRVTAIAIHPTNPNIVYAGTAQGGLYRTLNGGITWTQLLDTALSLAVGAVAIAPSDPGTVFVGTGEGNLSADCFFGAGVYVIRNADSSPAVAGPLTQNGTGSDVMTGNAVTKIVVHPNDPNTIFVSTIYGSGGISGSYPAIRPNSGVFRCSNALGSSPSFVSLTIGDVWVTDMTGEPGNAATLLYAVYGSGGSGGIYRTLNALAASPSFTRTLTLANIINTKFAINKIGSTVTVLAGTSENQGPGQGTLRRSTDGGASWSGPIPAANGFCDPQGNYDLAVAIDPNNASIIYLGGNDDDHIFQKSTDAGAIFSVLNTGLHPDTHAIEIAPSNPSILYTGNDGGIWRSSDRANSWKSCSSPDFIASQFQSVALHPTDRYFTMGGTQDNGTEWLRPDGTWTQVDFGDGGYTLIDQNATDTVNVTLYHTFYNTVSNLAGFGRVTSSTDAHRGGWRYYGFGSGFIPNGISSNDTAMIFYAPMALGPGNPNTLYFGTDRLYRSSDQGVTMTAVSQGPFVPQVPVTAIGISRQNDNIRIVGLRNGRIFATSTGSNPMRDVTGSLPPNRYISRTVIDPNDGNTAYVTVSGFGLPAGQHIWKTVDLNVNATWSAAGTGIPDIPVNSFAVDPGNSLNLFAGTDIGVYNSADGGRSWAPFGAGLPRVAVFDLAVHAVHRIVRAATHGRGMYEVSAAAAPPVLATQRNGQMLVLSWPATFNVRLESCNSLSPPQWGTATNQPTVVGGQKVVTIAPGGGSRFFRLAPGP